jgi:hypothetical protein
MAFTIQVKVRRVASMSMVTHRFCGCCATSSA